MKSIHLSACWDILHALDLSEEYEGRQFPVSVAMKLYTGDLVQNINSGRVKNSQRYGVTFYTELEAPDGTKVKNEIAVRVDANLKLSEFFNGFAEAFTMYGEFKIKGWPGASKMWASMIEKEYPDHKVTSAVGKVNCLAKVGKK
jgi:hypothetical protein